VLHILHKKHANNHYDIFVLFVIYIVLPPPSKVMGGYVLALIGM